MCVNSTTLCTACIDDDSNSSKHDWICVDKLNDVTSQTILITADCDMSHIWLTK